MSKRTTVLSGSTNISPYPNLCNALKYCQSKWYMMIMMHCSYSGHDCVNELCDMCRDECDLLDPVERKSINTSFSGTDLDCSSCSDGETNGRTTTSETITQSTNTLPTATTTVGEQSTVDVISIDSEVWDTNPLQYFNNMHTQAPTTLTVTSRASTESMGKALEELILDAMPMTTHQQQSYSSSKPVSASYNHCCCSVVIIDEIWWICGVQKQPRKSNNDRTDETAATSTYVHAETEIQRSTAAEAMMLSPILPHPPPTRRHYNSNQRSKSLVKGRIRFSAPVEPSQRQHRTTQTPVLCPVLPTSPRDKARVFFNGKLSEFNAALSTTVMTSHAGQSGVRETNTSPRQQQQHSNKENAVRFPSLL